MASQMSREQVDERWAADALDPIDDSWLQIGTMTAALMNKLEHVRAAITHQDCHERNFVKPSDFIPTPLPRVECDIEPGIPPGTLEGLARSRGNHR